MATMDKRTVTVFGDAIEVYWNGNVWVSPSNGQQHAQAEGAMRVELRRYFSSCGEDPDYPSTVEEINGYLSQMTQPKGSLQEAIERKDWSAVCDMVRPLIKERDEYEDGGDMLGDWVAEGQWCDVLSLTPEALAADYDDWVRNY